MPYQEIDADDPLEIIGVELPTSDNASVREMAECFIEELFRLGHTAELILAVFRNPFYGSAHSAYRVLGEPVIQELIRDYEILFSPRGGNQKGRE